MQGVKSKKFGAYWSSMMMTAMCLPEKIDTKNPEHIEKVKQYKIYYNSFQHILPCKFCKDFTKDVLMKQYPLDFSGRIPLMYSIFLWKKRVSEKLIKSGCDKTKPSPQFEVILKKYEKLRAKCDKSVGKCV